MTLWAIYLLGKRLPSKLFFSSLILSVLIGPSVVFSSHAMNGAAFLAIERAEGAVIYAYQMIYQVEREGGEIEGLTDRITWTVTLLDQAQVHFQLANYNEAEYFADLCYESALEISSEATTAVDTAREASGQRVWLIALNNVIVSCIIVCTSFFIWRFLVRRQYLRLADEVGGRL